jgi:peptidoglycan/xylan/chitin deacetylase (PgdA/CDA1 family)
MIRPPVLCYHRIGGPPELGVTRVARSVFVRQMTALARAGWQTLTLEEFARANSPYLFPVARLTTATRHFLLTFDDGYASLAEEAYPVLADLGFTAVTFLITDYVGRNNAWDVRYTWRRLPLLDWRTVERWRIRGFDFGSHGATHRRLTWLGQAVAAEELARSRGVLIQRLGTGAGQGIAYPFGAANTRVVELARRAGFELGFAGVWEGANDPLRLGRAPVYLWDVAAPPLVLRAGSVGGVSRFVAHVTNRCSVGTSAMLALGGRYRAGWRVPPAPPAAPQHHGAE